MSTHHADDDCARFHPEQGLNVIGFDNPVIAADVQAGDFFQDPALVWSWYLVRGVERPPCDQMVHMLLDEADGDELSAARDDAAAARLQDGFIGPCGIG